MKHKLLLLYSWLVRTLFFFIPDMPLTMRIRGWFYSLGMPRCGKNFQVTSDANIKTLENTYVGDNVLIGNNTILLGGGTITIGDNVLIGPQCIIVSGNHVFAGNSFNNKKADRGEIKIGSNCWIAANCTIAKGAEIPNKSILASNSFVGARLSKPHSIYGGSPAKYIKTINNVEQDEE